MVYRRVKTVKIKQELAFQCRSVPQQSFVPLQYYQLNEQVLVTGPFGSGQYLAADPSTRYAVLSEGVLQHHPHKLALNMSVLPRADRWR